MSTEQIQDIIKSRGITRLCHFVRTNKLLHILKHPEGIRASDFIPKDVFEANDHKRLDRATEYVNCSVEYPNYWYLKRIKHENKVFEDWAILFINTDIIREENSKFCVTNAATKGGALIKSGAEAFKEIFDDRIAGSNHVSARNQRKLKNAPTDDQAEILIYQNIPREYIDGVVFESEDIAKDKLISWDIAGISNEYDIYISKDLFCESVSRKVNAGIMPIIKKYTEEL